MKSVNSWPKIQSLKNCCAGQTKWPRLKRQSSYSVKVAQGKKCWRGVSTTRGKRAESAFIAVNCGALDENLVGSELFGHVKGAYTGAGY